MSEVPASNGQVDALQRLVKRVFPAEHRLLTARARHVALASVLTFFLPMATLAVCTLVYVSPIHLYHKRVEEPLVCSALSDDTSISDSWPAIDDIGPYLDSAHASEDDPYRIIGANFDELNSACLHARDRQSVLFTTVLVLGTAATLVAGFWLWEAHSARTRLRSIPYDPDDARSL